MFEIYAYNKEVPEDYFDMICESASSRIIKPSTVPIFKVFERNLNREFPFIFEAGVYNAMHSGSSIPDSTYAEFSLKWYPKQMVSEDYYDRYKIKIELSEHNNGVTVRMYDDYTVDAVIKGLKFILQALEDGVSGNNE